MSAMQPEAYTGVENLEIMQEARNYNRFLLNTVRAHAGAAAGGRILDFGAGNGEFVVPMTQLGFDITALEPDALLRRRLLDKQVRAVAGPDEIPDGSLQYVYTLNVLEHIPDDVAALRQLHGKLCAEGTLLIYVPAFPVLYTSMDAKVGHIRRYRRETLTAAVTAAGFAVDRVAYVDSLGFFATLAFKLSANTSGNVNRATLKLYDRLIFPLSRCLDLLTHHWFGKNLLLLARKKTPVHGARVDSSMQGTSR